MSGVGGATPAAPRPSGEARLAPDPSPPQGPKVGAAVLGAAGIVGQRLVERLQTHPFLELRALVGQDTAGKPYREAVSWQPDTPLQDAVARQRIQPLEEVAGRPDIPVVFSALPSGVAGPVESRLAAAGHKVFTNARDHRMGPAVPLLVPEVNAEHLALVDRQPGPGWIVANGNCSSILLAMLLAPLHRAFGVEEAHVTTLQGLSGAGYPGVSALDIVDNVLPHIPDEEGKLEAEPRKMLGRLTEGGVEPAPIEIHATATRVPVREGHLASLHV
ncbi:MAG TPA: aspartate-semialdehyde dehydrogenase, partial [Candidatus Thermoplasmatota archaeon]|nr:aspartate-semialdehyde dehydrogenase [Candidatus Thermoplasmatota archaeon]